jgi:hypothetical protein
MSGAVKRDQPKDFGQSRIHQCCASVKTETLTLEQHGQETKNAVAALTWSNQVLTGTGFPNHFYLGYTFYDHYFPMMALGGYLRARAQKGQAAKRDSTLMN